MENLDVMVLRTLRDWRVAGKRALLATVVRTWGSSPRPIGSIMALCETGAVVGSVSGGCIEDDLIYRFTQAYAHAATSNTSDAVRVQINGTNPLTDVSCWHNGTSCGSSLLLESVSSNANRLKFDVAYETLGDDAVIVWNNRNIMGHQNIRFGFNYFLLTWVVFAYARSI
jgi:xanthine/CO dehydrogenase XdhC/CoxF family maturation factor